MNLSHPCRRRWWLLLACASLAPATLPAQDRAPLFELGSLLDNVRVRPDSGELWIDTIGEGSLVAAFLPDDVRTGRTPLWGALRPRGGGTAPVAKIALMLEPIDDRFASARIKTGRSTSVTIAYAGTATLAALE